MSSSYEWSLIKLGDLVEGHRGVSYQPHHLLSDHSHDAVVLLRANNIQNGRLVFSDIQVVPEAIVKTDQLLAFGDMAVCMSNGSKSLVGKSAQYKSSLSGNVTVGAFCSIFRPKQDADSGYIKQIFHSAIYQAHIDYSLAGSAINNLKNSDIESLELMVPPKFIQQKIARILQVIDKAIEKTEALISKYQQIKAGLMHDLFTRGIGPDGKLRPPREQAPELYKETPIGWIPKEWVFDTCEDVCEKVIDCKNRTPPITPDGHPVIRTPNVRYGQFVDDGLVYTDTRSYSVWTARGAPQPGDIVITREAPVGEVCKIPERHQYACLGQRMMLYRVDREKISDDFFLYVLQSRAVQARLDLISGGSTVGHVRVGDIRTLWIFYPESRDEQLQIARALNHICSKLDTEASFLEALQKQKNGLMHDLLTGKVPVQVESEAKPEAVNA